MANTGKRVWIHLGPDDAGLGSMRTGYHIVTLAALVGLLNNLLEKRSNGREKLSITEIVHVMNKIKSLHFVLYSPDTFELMKYDKTFSLKNFNN